MKAIANRVMQMPARVAQPEAITGMADPLRSPAYSTSVGLLRLGLIMDVEDDRRDKLRKPDSRRRTRVGGDQIASGLVKGLGGIFRRFVPNIDDES
jgi:cell division ATPase FtsA